MFNVTLQKRVPGAKQICGSMTSIPERGEPVIIDLGDDSHYVTTEIVRIVEALDKNVFYFETLNNRYRLQVNDV